MSGFIAAFAIQQLRDMEQLQRDFGHRPSLKPRRAARRAAAAAEAAAVARAKAIIAGQQRPSGAGAQVPAVRAGNSKPTTR